MEIAFTRTSTRCRQWRPCTVKVWEWISNFISHLCVITYPYRYQSQSMLVYPAAGSNQMGCGCTWQRSLSLESNSRATYEIPVLIQSWGGCNHSFISIAIAITIARPPSSIACPLDLWLLVPIIVRHLPLTTCSWSVQCYRKVVTNITQLINWIPSSRQFPRLV